MCQHCGGFVAAANPNTDAIARAFSALSVAVRNGEIEAGEVPIQLANAISTELTAAINDIVPDTEMGWMMRQSVFSFSAAKSYQELLQLSQLVIDGDKIRSFSEFKRLAFQVHEKFNLNWLNTEYNFAVSSAQNGARWWEFRENEAAMPLLKYQTIGDSRVRDSHRELNGQVRGIRSAFWATYYPPNGWNCRCEAIQVSDQSINESDGKWPNINVQPPFKTNLAHTGVIFPDDSPYYKGITDEMILMSRPSFIKALKPTEKLLRLHPEFSHTELVCMYNYTDHDYMYLNPLMRNKIVNKFIREYGKNMTSALSKLDKHDGYCFRGFGTPELLNYEIGQKVPFPEYLSSSLRYDKAYEYMKSSLNTNKYMMIIKSKSGRYVGKISAAGEGESEILFNANTSLEVVNIEQRPGYILIEAVEI